MMTAEEFNRLTGGRRASGGSAPGIAPSAWKIRRANKYRAKAVGGYASKKECRRAQELRIMQRAGLISDLREQVPFELIPAQYAPVSDHRAEGASPKGMVERPCRYVADFVYRDRHGNQVVEDTKGVRTREYIIKRKLMLFMHGIRIHEV